MSVVGGGRLLVGVDGGGTRTTLVVADEHGREVARRVGPAGLVDPRRPAATAEMLAGLVQAAIGSTAPVERPAALVAGLAGVGNAAERGAVEAALAAAGVADHVSVRTDGEIALEGALGAGAGILLIAGTGSVAYGRGDDGRVERSGGWGMVVGDEGSGWSLARAALVAALRASDGRGPDTRLLPLLLEVLGVEGPRGIPPWVGRAEKAEVAALARNVLAAAVEGDEVALRVVRSEAGELALHVVALARRLAPWHGEVPVVFLGGVLASYPFYAQAVAAALECSPFPLRVRPAVADAVAGALSFARQLAGTAVREYESTKVRE